MPNYNNSAIQVMDAWIAFLLFRFRSKVLNEIKNRLRFGQWQRSKRV